MDENEMKCQKFIPVIGKEFETIFPQVPLARTAAVFNKESASIAFNFGNCDFVIALNELTGQFAYCRSIAECVEFWGLDTDTYQYEMYLDSEPNHLFQFNCWLPVSDQYLRDKNINIEEKLASGILRKIQK